MRNDLCAVAHVLTHARPRGVPLPHRGYTFDSAGLASVTQPTLGNNASEEATPLGLYFFHHIITHPNEAVGAVPVCPPERSRSGVSIPKILALCAGDEQRMRPCSATRAGTQAPPLPIPIIFIHATSHKQNNHLRAIHPNKTNRPCVIHPNDINHLCAIHPNEINRPPAIHPNKTVGAVPVCPPERPHSGVSIRK